jgi:hypothetical protein
LREQKFALGRLPLYRVAIGSEAEKDRLQKLKSDFLLDFELYRTLDISSIFEQNNLSITE